MNVESELTLRAHIRKLLLRYSLTHLTTNYATYTRTAVSELLSESLSLVPTEEPTSLALPMDSYEALCQKLRLREQKPYDQTWTIDAESRRFIFDTLGKGQTSESATRRCWSAENETFSYNPHLPFTSVLTTRAIRETPTIGVLSAPSASLKSFSSFDSRFLERVNIKPVPGEPYEETVISPPERDRLLDISPIWDKDTYQTLKLLTTQSTSIRDGLVPIPSMVSGFLRDDDSLPLAAYHPMSPPIFPRQMAITGPPGLEKLSDIHSLGFVTKVEAEHGEVEDMSKAHMLLVDDVLAPPPTSQRSSTGTPSLDAGSQSSQMELDELFALTPPQQSLIAHGKMEEYLIPRSHKPGSVQQKNRVDEPEESLATFLPSLLPPAPLNFDSEFPNITRPDTSPVSSSILGQPPSPFLSPGRIDGPAPQLETRPAVGEDSQVLDPGLEALINKLCAPVAGQSAEDWILDERIDEQEALMMDVPKLREPHLHPASPSCPTLPSSVRSLVSTKKTKHQSATSSDPEPAAACLKKVTGMQSLNIELTWRPFNFGTSVPRAEELVKVEQSPKLDMQSDFDQIDGTDENELEGLLDAVGEPGTGAKDMVGDDDPPVDWTLVLGEDWSRDEVILTRADRARRSGHQSSFSSDADSDGAAENKDISESALDAGADAESPLRPPQKRRRVDTSATPAPLQPEEAECESAADSEVVPFSFHRLCSPKGETLSQPRSQDAPFWNVEDMHEFGTGQAGAQAFLDHHRDPMEAKVLATGGTVSEEGHGTTSRRRKVDADDVSFAESQAGLSPSATPDIPFPEQPSTQHHNRTPPSHIAESAAKHTAHRRLATVRRLEKASAQEALFNFMKIRGKATHEPNAILSSQPESEPQLIYRPPSPPRAAPPELMDPRTLSLPDDWVPPLSRHRYIASLDIIQKTILVKHLTSPDCNVDLAERDVSATGGADLIVDADTALLFVVLSSLPVTSVELADRVARLSWDFAHIVIVFEAFSTSFSYRQSKNEAGAGLAPYAFPPAIIKAIRNFKRTLTILEGMETGNKRRDAEVRYAYARDVSEAARFGRLVGDMSERACAAAMWGDDREWLTDDYPEGETDLARVRGMNVFVAAMILRYVDLNSFIDMEAGHRLERFSAIVGEQRMAMFNQEVASRLAQVAASSPLSFSPTAESAVSAFKPGLEDYGDYAPYYDGAYEKPGVFVDDFRAYSGDGLRQDAMEWQTTGLLFVPGTESQVMSGDPYSV